MGGLFARTDRLEEVGVEIFVDLVKPGWKRQLTLNARITSRLDAVDGRLSKRMPGMGIQFVKLDDKQHDRLISLLRELGAPEEDLQVTLNEEATELELRALDLDLGSGSEGLDLETPLDPQPQPLWQQVEMVESESALHSLVDDIEGAIREANLPAPGPVFLDPDQPARPPAVPDVQARLMFQLQGLVMQLADAQAQLSQRDAEIQRLKEELATVRSALERSVRKS